MYCSAQERPLKTGLLAAKKALETSVPNHIQAVSWLNSQMKGHCYVVWKDAGSEIPRLEV